MDDISIGMIARLAAEHKDVPNIADKIVSVLKRYYDMHNREITAPDENASPLNNIDVVHRGNDGYACFTRKKPSTGPEEKIGMDQMFSVPMAHFGNWLPEIRKHVLGTDCYYTLNAMFAGAPYRSKVVPGLPGGKRKASAARYITSCWVDCDIRGNMTAAQQALAALVVIEKARSNGVCIPEWSIMVHSGQGFWLIWLLREEDQTPGSGKPIRLYGYNTLALCQAWNRIQDQLCLSFAELNSDAGSIDIARLTRVPGSTHSTNGNTVAYRLNFDSGGNPIAYTLCEMSALLNVAPPTLKVNIKKAVDPVRSEQARAKRKIMLRKRMVTWQQLADIRGGYKVGHRSKALFVVAATMRQLGIDRNEIRSSLYELNSRYCDPPMKKGEVDDARTGARNTRAVTNRTIGDWLRVTKLEADLTGWPYYGCVPDQSLRGNSRAKVQNRRELLRRNIRVAGGEILSAGQHAERLEALGIFVGIRTIQSDLKSMRLE